MQQISSLSAKIKLLKAKILYPTAYDDNNNKLNPTTYGTTAPCGPYIPQEVPPIFSTPAHLLHPCIPRMRNASVWTMSSPLVLGVPTDLVLLIIIIIMYCQSNFNGKYCGIFGPKIA